MTYLDEAIEKVACQWFALCENAAADVRDGGPLGQVPICTRCSEKVDAIEGVS